MFKLSSVELAKIKKLLKQDSSFDLEIDKVKKTATAKK
jgi:hypothetical protein